MFLLFICFLAGILTVLAPCVLPLLPVIIGGSIGGNKKDVLRPYLIAASLAGSVIVFTLVLKVSTALIHLSPDILTVISGGLIIVLGIFSFLPELWEKLIIQLNWQAASQRLLGRSEHNTDRYIGPILIGIALGPVFSSCSPTYAFILASVLPKHALSGLADLVAYSIGLVLTLLAVSLIGRSLIKRAAWAVDTHGLFRRVLGLLFIIVGVVIISGQSLKTEVWIANHVPFDETKIEQLLLAKQHTGVAPKISQNSSAYGNVLNVAPTPAPEFQGLTNWINSKPLQLAKLKGHVVLVDFWTYSCINCIRSLPYVEKWYQAYQKDGFIVIGVSTPEFAFEHIPSNVAKAVKADGIEYPVALDNSYDTWNAFQNDSWPADYLIDQTGNIRYVGLGEGNYNVTEEAIQTLLGIRSTLKTPVSSVPITNTQTDETYFGTYRSQNYSGQPELSNGNAVFTSTPESQLPPNNWTLSGKWHIDTYAITSGAANSQLVFNVSAKDVYMVAGSQNNLPESVGVSLPSTMSSQFGPDAPGGVVTVNGSRLYHIVSLPQAASTTVTLTVPAGVELYTFTFGS